MTDRRAPAALAALAAVALVAAGCGARSSAPYTPKGTISCLKGKGFLQITTKGSKLGPIAAFAQYGGLQARTADKNVVTIAFAADQAAAAATKKAYRSAATPFYRQRMDEIMQSQRNAVMVWTLAPTQQQIDDVESCLHS
ncbi:MAG TPA: hypothetical protein VJ986_10340 [Gaiellaceae bacterium]|nr:hypothetical protein [Gaiellaceae bacterium]